MSAAHGLPEAAAPVLRVHAAGSAPMSAAPPAYADPWHVHAPNSFAAGTGESTAAWPALPPGAESSLPTAEAISSLLPESGSTSALALGLVAVGLAVRRMSARSR